MKARSPIEMMIDQACGIDPNAEPAVQAPSTSPDTQALIDVGDAATSWLRAVESGDQDHIKDAQRVLQQAATVLCGMGWEL